MRPPSTRSSPESTASLDPPRTAVPTRRLTLVQVPALTSSNIYMFPLCSPMPDVCRSVYTASDDKPARVLLPVRNLQFWIDTNILLLLKDAPFNKRDAQLLSVAGSCADCPKRTGHNKLLFGDDLGRQDDQCTDPICYQSKVEAHVAKAIAAKPELVQISTGFGVQKEGSRVLPRNKYTAIRDDRPKSKDKTKLPEFKECKHTTEAIITDGTDTAPDPDAERTEMNEVDLAAYRRYLTRMTEF